LKLRDSGRKKFILEKSELSVSEDRLRARRDEAGESRDSKFEIGFSFSPATLALLGKQRMNWER